MGDKGKGGLGNRLYTLLRQPGDVTGLLRRVNSHYSFSLGLGNGNFPKLRRPAEWGPQSTDPTVVKGSGLDLHPCAHVPRAPSPALWSLICDSCDLTEPGCEETLRDSVDPRTLLTNSLKSGFPA